MNTYKLVLIGDGGVGKSTYLKKLIYRKFEQKYVATLGVEVHPFMFDGSKFNIWDCAGQEKLGGLRDGYYIQADCAIVMFDWSNKLSIRNVSNWVRDFVRVCPDKPYIIVGNKANLMNPQAWNQSLISIKDPIISIDTKNNQNTQEPFNNLLTKL